MNYSPPNRLTTNILFSLLKTRIRSLSLASLIFFSLQTFSLGKYPPNFPIILASTNSDVTQQGKVITLNGRQFPVAWSQWLEGGILHTGISDTGTQPLFGWELTSTNNKNSQPVNWFSSQNLTTKFISPYRYLDVTDFLQRIGAEISVSGDKMMITYNSSQIQDLTIENHGTVQRVIITLARPTFWQVSRVKNEGVITIKGNADPSLLSRFPPVPVSPNSPTIDEDDLGGNSGDNSTNRRVSLENTGSTTRLKIPLPTAYELQVTSVSNPNRIVIDSRPDPMTEKQILWQEGLIWHQKYLPLQQDWFPVTWLEIDPSVPNLTLKPIITNPTAAKGTSPLVKMSSASQAVAAINGGFFNRNNQLPLGAIRVQGRWLSGPILGRGAIAWDNQGNFSIGRLRLEETLITATGQRLPITHLNSAYLESGISRYTRDWGTTYTPLTAQETVIIVENNRVAARYSPVSSPENLPIPAEGYLLVSRKTDLFLPVGTSIQLDSVTLPAAFARYPYIMGAGPLLLENGRIVLAATTEKFSQAFQDQKASRSAIATTKDGKVLLVAIHNRVGGKGATLAEFARILQGMGAINALNLDGGSSTGIVLGGHLIDRSVDTAANVHNGIGVFLSPSP